MKLGKELRPWLGRRKPDIDIGVKEERAFAWQCTHCAGEISVPLRERLHELETYPRGDFTTEEKKEAERFYGMGQWSRAPSGGGIHFEKIKCPRCSTPYLFSYGVDEPSNSFLVLTVEGIIEIGEDGPNRVAGSD
jgi:hypothetical protein